MVPLVSIALVRSQRYLVALIARVEELREFNGSL